MIKKILIERKKLGLTWDVLSKGLPIGSNSLRVAFQRGSVNEVYLNHVQDIIDKIKKDENKNNILTNNEELIVLESIKNNVIENHKKLLNLREYSLWFEAQCQKRVIEILKE